MSSLSRMIGRRSRSRDVCHPNPCGVRPAPHMTGSHMAWPDCRRGACGAGAKVATRWSLNEQVSVDRYRFQASSCITAFAS